MCPACYLFGCTGWSGKFNLRVTESDSNSPKKSSLTEKISFELHFIEKKEFEEAENTLLKMTLKLIVDYGAIGGRTVFKPSEDTWKNVYTYKQIGIHADYGLIARLTNKEGEDISNIPTSQILNNDNRIIIENYLGKFTTVKKENHSDWPDLNYFWFVNGIYINRETHNEIVKRDPNNPKNYLPNADADFHKWLGGKPGEKEINLQ